MPERLRWKPSELPEGSYVVGVCERCHEHRYPTRALMIEKAGDVPLWRIEQRLRCIARNGDKRGPACGGRMVMEIACARAPEPAAVQRYPVLPGLAWPERQPQ